MQAICCQFHCDGSSPEYLSYIDRWVHRARPSIGVVASATTYSRAKDTVVAEAATPLIGSILYSLDG
jgi:hypothetical protein